jgi:hypothetical protein
LQEIACGRRFVNDSKSAPSISSYVVQIGAVEQQVGEAVQLWQAQTAKSRRRATTVTRQLSEPIKNHPTLQALLEGDLDERAETEKSALTAFHYGSSILLNGGAMSPQPFKKESERKNARTSKILPMKLSMLDSQYFDFDNEDHAPTVHQILAPDQMREEAKKMLTKVGKNSPL